MKDAETSSRRITTGRRHRHEMVNPRRCTARHEALRRRHRVVTDFGYHLPTVRASPLGLFGLCLIALPALSCSSTTLPHDTVRSGFLPTAQGARLAFQVRGTGSDTVVLLHGGPGLHGNSVRGLVDALLAGRTFIIYDQRGRGRSDAVTDSTQLTVANDVADLEAVRVYFKLERLTLVAHHWGAIIAALYAKQHPERVDRLLLVSPS